MVYLVRVSWRSLPVICCLTLAVFTTLTSACFAQEVAFLDLTTIAARQELRRPKASSPITGRYSGTQQTSHCPDPTHTIGLLHTGLVSLDRTYFRIDDEPTFEVTVGNAGSTPVRIPFSPHLAELQPENPAQKFAYFELQISLWIAGGERWSTNTFGSVVLYGSNDHVNTMLTLNPGEWVRLIAKGHPSLDVDFVKRALSTHPADHVYAQAALYHRESLITPTQSATVGREVCLAQTQGRSLPIELTIP